MGKSLQIDDASVNHGKGEQLGAKTPENSGSGKVRSRPQLLRGDALTEFRQSVRKVELPLFDGKNPAGWISRAELYFRVQET